MITKSFAHRVILFFVLWMSLPLWANNIQHTAMVDPLLGLSFSPQQVKFEIFPDPKHVKNVDDKNIQWVFASYRNPRTSMSIVIVAGFQKVHSDGSGKVVVEPDYGAVIKISSKKQRIIGVPDRLFGQHPILDAGIVNELMRDAVNRYIKAFGGIDHLTREITDQGIRGADLSPILVNQLANRGIQLRPE